MRNHGGGLDIGFTACVHCKQAIVILASEIRASNYKRPLLYDYGIFSRLFLYYCVGFIQYGVQFCNCKRAGLWLAGGDRFVVF